MAEKRSRPDGGTPDSASKRARAANNPSTTVATNGHDTARSNVDMAKTISDLKARADAARARIGGGRAPPASSALEAMRARVAAATAKSNDRSKDPLPNPPAEFQENNASRERGGLGVGLHPSLMQDASQDTRSSGRQAPGPKFATTMANRRESAKPKKQLDLSGPNFEELKKNPYFDTSLHGPAQGGVRLSKQIVFTEKGKHIAQANAWRRQLKLEEMKARIARQARKAGIDEDNEKAFLVSEPPAVEWWDEGLLQDSGYDILDEPGKLDLDSESSIITIYVQHPVPIEPPQDKNIPAPKPMFLTKKEQSKKRRQQRLEKNKEQQAKIRLGLEPPPPPRVTKANMMKVFGEEAVKDPTAVEARVNREIKERLDKHEAENASRKLTKEERHAKLERNQENDAAKGIYICAFKISNLAYGKHRYQIDINAKQNSLTGTCIMHPKFCLVIVEGGEHSIKNYKKLMLNRVKWTENAAPSSVREGNQEAEAAWLQSLDADGEVKDMSFNKCQLLWEGQLRQRTFRKWAMRVCESDADAKDVLVRPKMEYMWTLAKSSV